MTTKAVAEVKPAPVEARNSFTPARSLVLQRKCACGGSTGSSGNCDSCNAKSPLLQRHATADGPIGNVPSIVHNVLSSAGHPLDTGTRSFMESRFGHDFSGVRVHSDSQAAESARAVSAHAYTVGQHVVFGEGQYSPESSHGRHLLAHELAHTIQQRGLQRYASDLRLGDASEARYEAEADRAAAMVTSSDTGLGQTPSITHTPIAPIISRQATSVGQTPLPTTTPPSNTVPQPTRAWQDLDPSDPLRALGITAKQEQLGIVGFRVSQFQLPGTKGLVLSDWEARCNAQALEATIEFRGNDPPRTGLWQSRDRTSELRQSWLGKLGWTDANARDNWFNAGGKAIPPGAPFSPKVGPGAGTTCQMDHKIELQLGGTNARENVQVLDATENRESGTEIWRAVSTLAKQARETLPNPKPTYILLHFDQVVQAPAVSALSSFPGPGAATKCSEVEQCALSRRVTPTPGQDSAGRALEAYPIESAGTRDTLQVLPAPQPTDLTGAENRAATQLIPGMLLRRLQRQSGNAPDNIDAVVDSANLIGNSEATRVPLLVQNSPGPIQFRLNRDNRQLTMVRPASAPVEFLYPYLSRGTLNLRYDPRVGMVGTGRLTSSLPILSRAPMNLEFAPGRLRAFFGSAQRNLPTGLPGLRITEATLGVDILPEFRPVGRLVFAAGPERRPFITGSLEASADMNGLVFTGNVDAHIPNTDVAHGTVTYRNGQWSGYAVVESRQIRFPGVQSGQIRVDFNSNGSIVPSGQVELLVAGNPVTVSARYVNGVLTFRGNGTFRVRGLNPINATIETDGTWVNFNANTTVSIRNLTGNVAVQYRTGRWSADGTVRLEKGPASGTVTLHLSPQGNVFGEGRLTYRISERLTASMGILLREDHSIRVNGEILLAPVQLFQRFPAARSRTRLFRTHIGIPILGFSLGPIGDVGLVLAIDPEIGVYYGIGPGEFRNIRIGAAFDPMADNPNLEFEAAGQLYIPFDAGFYLTIPAGLSLSAVIASVSARLEMGAEIGVRGNFGLDSNIRYRAQRWSVATTAGLYVNPRLALNIDGVLRAEAGIGPFSKSAEKRWRLSSWEWGSNMRFGVEFPFSWASDQPFQFPSFDNIRFIRPDPIDFRSLIGDVVSQAR